MLPMEELASLPLLWRREQIRESKRDEGSGNHSICEMMLNVSLVLSCQETAGSATCIWKHGSAGSYAWVIVNCMDAFVLYCFEALAAVILYLHSVQNVSNSRKWSSMSRNHGEARSNHVCEWSELMLGWQRGYCFFAGSRLEKVGSSGIGRHLLHNRKHSVTLARIVRDFVL